MNTLAGALTWYTAGFHSQKTTWILPQSLLRSLFPRLSGLSNHDLCAALLQHWSFYTECTLYHVKPTNKSWSEHQKLWTWPHQIHLKCKRSFGLENDNIKLYASLETAVQRQNINIFSHFLIKETKTPDLELVHVFKRINSPKRPISKSKMQKRRQKDL